MKIDFFFSDTDLDSISVEGSVPPVGSFVYFGDSKFDSKWQHRNKWLVKSVDYSVHVVGEPSYRAEVHLGHPVD